MRTKAGFESGKSFMANTTNITNEIALLENRIAKLDNDSFSMLRDWFIEFDQARWDKKLEADSNSGKLDFLINSALAEHQAGKTREL
jgi:hypothetical protein